jgi:hypothetical protein
MMRAEDAWLTFGEIGARVSRAPGTKMQLGYQSAAIGPSYETFVSRIPQGKPHRKKKTTEQHATGLHAKRRGKAKKSSEE